MTPRACPVHRRPLVCPACTGGTGGKATSAAKTLAARENAKRPRPRRPKD